MFKRHVRSQNSFKFFFGSINSKNCSKYFLQLVFHGQVLELDVGERLLVGPQKPLVVHFDGVGLPVLVEADGLLVAEETGGVVLGARLVEEGGVGDGYSHGARKALTEVHVVGGGYVGALAPLLDEVRNRFPAHHHASATCDVRISVSSV